MMQPKEFQTDPSSTLHGAGMALEALGDDLRDAAMLALLAARSGDLDPAIGDAISGLATLIIAAQKRAEGDAARFYEAAKVTRIVS